MPGSIFLIIQPLWKYERPMCRFLYYNCFLRICPIPEYGQTALELKFFCVFSGEASAKARKRAIGGVMRLSALTRRCAGIFHMLVNCQPARRECLPVLVPAQAIVRAGERRGMRNAEYGIGARRMSACLALRLCCGGALGSRMSLWFCRGDLSSVHACVCGSAGVFCVRCASAAADLAREAERKPALPALHKFDFSLVIDLMRLGYYNNRWKRKG